jgi:two-component system nitrate/nitrite response regulator NarL
MAHADAGYDAVAVTTVLIVDDDAAFRRVASELLEDLGFCVVGAAADGQQAIAEAARLRPDAVLLDVQMPDTDGFSVACQLTRRQGAPRVLLISTDGSAGSAGTLESSGAVGFLAKHELAVTDLRRLLGSAP